MKVYKTNIKDTKYSHIIELSPLNDKNSLYVDIETTGFSRKTDMIYLIGLLYYEDDELVVVQYLCEKLSDEYELLYKFNQLVTNFDELIQFNGDSFDLPFIKERMKLYRIKENLSTIKSLDFLKLLRSVKKVLGTDNMKLKTMEKLAGYRRLDTFSGGDLIQLYKMYLNGDSKLETSFIQHNEEDMIGLYYLNVFRPLISINNLNTSHCRLEIKTSSTTLQIIIHMQLPSNYYSFDLNREPYLLNLLHDKLTLTLPLLSGEYKTFFEDYKNYYYLPIEDYAIHESVANFVQAKYKKKANKHNAYTKINDTFIQCPLTKKQLLNLTNNSSNIYIFNKTINDSFSLLRQEDLQSILHEILPIILKHLIS